MNLWQHEDCGYITWANKRPSHRWYEIPFMYEDDLPDTITDEEYSFWYKNSIVDGVRIGPKII